MNKKHSLTIGIPVYNEEANIKKLITSVLSQKLTTFSLEEIIISSDGSTDKTVEAVKSIRNPRISLIVNQNRKGIARGINQIMSRASSKALVVLDADIHISDPETIERLARPIVTERVDLASPGIGELDPQSFFGRTLWVSMRLKEQLFAQLNHGENMYTCHGQARAFSRRFYSRLLIPVSIGNDMYCYLSCKKRGLTYRYVPESTVLYRLPETYADHKKQSLRFFVSADEQRKFFSPEFVKGYEHIPFSAYIAAFVKSVPVLVKYPLHSLFYFFVQLSLRTQSPSTRRSQTWDVAVSSKLL